ncbi:hypothetical protein AB0H77_06270 [Streptomyces sp. NPDC050844]|uniref:hypothetical protein n=1 Tax=Streptomyces sp. NPDC050844 TaxID=3155790 RepID=UPI0033CFECE5
MLKGQRPKPYGGQLDGLRDAVQAAAQGGGDPARCSKSQQPAVGHVLDERVDP